MLGARGKVPEQNQSCMMPAMLIMKVACENKYDLTGERSLKKLFDEQPDIFKKLHAVDGLPEYKRIVEEDFDQDFEEPPNLLPEPDLVEGAQDQGEDEEEDEGVDAWEDDDDDDDDGG